MEFFTGLLAGILIGVIGILLIGVSLANKK